MTLKLFLLVAVLTVSATQAATPRFRAVSGMGDRAGTAGGLPTIGKKQFCLECMVCDGAKVKVKASGDITKITSPFWATPRDKRNEVDAKVVFKCAKPPAAGDATKDVYSGNCGLNVVSSKDVTGGNDSLGKGKGCVCKDKKVEWVVGDTRFAALNGDNNVGKKPAITEGITASATGCRKKWSVKNDAKNMEWVVATKSYMAKQATCDKGTKDAAACAAAGKMTCSAAQVEMCKFDAKAKKCVPGDLITGKLTQ